MFPVLVLWHQDDSLYSPPFYADAWFYLGYFKNLIEFKRDLFVGFYYGSRLSWILPGALVHALFSPVAANAILHLLVHSVATLSLFSILRLTSGVRAAFLGAMVFAVNPWLWVATGWDYVDGAGIAYTLLAMALLTEAAVRPIRKWILLMAGAALACMGYTHLFLGTMIPLPLLYYCALVWIWHRPEAKFTIVNSGLWLAAGIAIVTLAFCLVNLWLEGKFWFYAPSFKQAVFMAKNFHYIKPVWTEGELVSWLWPVVLGCFTAIVLIPARLRKGPTAIPLLFAGLLLAATGYMVLMQLRGSTVMGHYPYASYLLPFTFLVIGTSYWTATATMSLRVFTLLCVSAATSFAALWFDPAERLAGALPPDHWNATIGTACALLAALLLRHRQAGAFLAIAGFAGATAVALAQTTHSYGDNLHGTRAQYERIMNARAQIEAHRHGRPMRFWYDDRERNFYQYYGLAALYMAEFSRLGTHFPRDCDQPIPPDSMVVVLSRFGQASDMAVAALSACWQQNDLHPVVELVKSIDGEPEPFTMVLLRADPGEMSPTTSADVIKTVDLTTARPGDSSAHLEQSAGGVRVTTPSGPGAFAARFKLGLDPGVEGRFIVRVHAKVDNGQIAIGVLDATGARFLIEKPMWASRNSAQVMLQLPSPPVTGDLIVCNMDTHEVRSSATIQKIDIVRAPKQ